MYEEAYVIVGKSDEKKEYYVEKQIFAAGSEEVKQARREYEALCNVAPQRGYRIVIREKKKPVDDGSMDELMARIDERIINYEPSRPADFDTISDVKIDISGQDVPVNPAPTNLEDNNTISRGR